MIEVCYSSQSAEVNNKMPNDASTGKKRIRLTIEEKIIAMQHFENNPGLSYPELIDWCSEKFGLQEKLSISAVSHWFSKKAGKRSLLGKIKAAMESRVNRFPSAAKSFQGAHYPDLERELLAWLCQIQSREACLAYDELANKAMVLAKTIGAPTFRASQSWIKRFKVRHGIELRCVRGEGFLQTL